jgi:hypothetical protein
MTFRTGIALAALLTAAACASDPDANTDPDPLHEEIDPSVQETLVYLDTVKPPEVQSVRFREPLRYDVVNVRFVYMDVSSGRYLIQMARDCKPLKNNEIYTDMADRRSMRGRIRSGIDTIRGCRIESIYELPEPEETRADDSGQTESADGPPDTMQTDQEPQ